MKYACLVYIDADLISQLTPEEGAALTDRAIDFDWDLHRRGELILAQPLQPPASAVTISVRNGRLSSTDGPFAETKEFLGGFFLIEAPDIAEAARIAGTSPMASLGSIEIRPFLDQTQSVTGKRRPPL